MKRRRLFGALQDLRDRQFIVSRRRIHVSMKVPFIAEIRDHDFAGGVDERAVFQVPSEGLVVFVDA